MICDAGVLKSVGRTQGEKYKNSIFYHGSILMMIILLIDHAGGFRMVGDFNNNGVLKIII